MMKIKPSLETQNKSDSQLCRNSNFDNLLPFNLFLCCINTSPAFEKSLSEGTDVATIPKYFEAIFNKLGYAPLISCHKLNEFVLNCPKGLCRYCVTSDNLSASAVQIFSLFYNFVMMAPKVEDIFFN